MSESDDEPAREAPRRRGRHAAPAPSPAAAEGTWRARARAALAPLLAAVEPRLSAAGAWLLERRLHVFIISAAVAVIALLGGTVALLQLSAPQPEDEATTVLRTSRPTSSDPAAPNTLGPILPSPGPSTPGTPVRTTTPTPAPGDDAQPPVDEEDPVVGPTPEPTKEPGRDTAPGQTKKPDPPDGG
jgi:hypothetical protein